MMQAVRLAVACVAVLAAMAAQVQAGIVTYTNSSAFDAAVGSSVLEDFNSSTLERFVFGTDYQFDGFTISASPNPSGTGPGVGIANSSLSNIDNTRRLVWGFQTFGGNGYGYGPQIVFTFDAPVLAFGFDWRDTDPTDSYKLNVLGQNLGATSTGPYPVLAGQGFFGLVSDTAFTMVILEQVARGGALDDMSMDNVRFSPVPQSATVPEPSSLAVFAFGACVAGVGVARRRRRDQQQVAPV